MKINREVQDRRIAMSHAKLELLKAWHEISNTHELTVAEELIVLLEMPARIGDEMFRRDHGVE